MNGVTKNIMIYSLAGIMQVGLGETVIEASAFNNNDIQIVQLDRHDEQRENAEWRRHESERHEQEMRRHQHENDREWHERQERENRRHETERHQYELHHQGFHW